MAAGRAERSRDRDRFPGDEAGGAGAPSGWLRSARLTHTPLCSPVQSCGRPSWAPHQQGTRRTCLSAACFSWGVSSYFCNWHLSPLPAQEHHLFLPKQCESRGTRSCFFQGGFPRSRGAAFTSSRRTQRGLPEAAPHGPRPAHTERALGKECRGRPMVGSRGVWVQWGQGHPAAGATGRAQAWCLISGSNSGPC